MKLKKKELVKVTQYGKNYLLLIIILFKTRYFWINRFNGK